MTDDQIDLHSGNGGQTSAASNVFSSSSSLGSNKSRFRYRGNMLAVKAMAQLPPVEEQQQQSKHFIDGFNPFKRSKKIILFCAISVFFYLFLGTLTYSLWIPEWTVIDAMYFTVATLTTVGYGDIVPLNDGQRAFTLFFVLSGVFVIGGLFIALIFDDIFSHFDEITKDAKAATSDYFITRLDNGGPDGLFFEEEKTMLYDLCKTFTKIVPMLVALIVPPLIMGYYEDWNVLSSLYFTVVSATTVGYGDIAPKNMWMRFITVFYLPVCVGVMARSFAKLTGVLIRHKARESEMEFKNRKLTESDLELMDVEGDGNVGYDEFLVFMLVATGKVDPEDIQRMEELYQRLDADNDGGLKIEDVFTMAYGDIKDV